MPISLDNILKEINTFTESDISHAEELVQTLKPVKVATCVMSDESNPTLSVIAPLNAQLLQATWKSIGDTQFVKEIKEAIHQDLKKRYADDMEKTKLRMASVLDARFKTLPFMSDDDRRETYRRVVDEAVAIAEHQHPQVIKYFNKPTLSFIMPITAVCVCVHWIDM